MSPFDAFDIESFISPASVPFIGCFAVGQGKSEPSCFQRTVNGW